MSLRGEDNADVHLKRQIMDRGDVVAMISGKLDFGTGNRFSMGNLSDGVASAF